jgi:hypothetical protein
VRRARSTPQRQRDEAQRGNWVFYEAINKKRVQTADDQPFEPFAIRFSLTVVAVVF